MEQITEPKPANFLAEWTAEWQRDPDNTYEPGRCARCACSLGADPAAWIQTFKVGGIAVPRPVRYCDPCIEIITAERKVEDRKQRDAAFARIIPVEFNFWDERFGNAPLLTKVSSLYPDPNQEPSGLPRGNYASARGILMHGTTGSCKTRVAWQIIKRLLSHAGAYTWLWCDAFDLATKGIPAEATFAQWLVIDDLGNEPTSTKYETALLRLLKVRCDWHKPTIITTQLTGAVFKSRFFEGATGQAIDRRLRERTDMVSS